MTGPDARPVIAIFPWGDVVEEFLEPIGLTLDDFVNQMSGGWLFGYVSALRHAGWEPIIVLASECVGEMRHMVHAHTGASIWIVPGRRVVQGRSPAIWSIRRWLATPMTAFRDVLERQQCRAILIQEYEYTRFDALVRLSARIGVPAYATFQGGDRSLSWIERAVRKRSLQLCAGLIIASSDERRRVEHVYYGSHPPIAPVPNPLDCQEWQAMDKGDARRQLGLPQDAFIAINHGRIDIWRKGLDILLGAWSGNGDDMLVVIGSGQDHAKFEQMLKLRVGDDIRWISDYVTDRPRIRQWLSAADVYVTASRVEGMPVAPLEAMACGLPVIATDAQGLPDILDHGGCGILVPRDDIPALTAAIMQIRSDDGLRNRLGRAARIRAENAYSITAVGQALAHVLPNF